MADVVRRVSSTLTHGSTDGPDIAPIERRGEGLVLHTTTTRGVQPSIQLAWEVESWYWHNGYRLLGFRSTSSFSSDSKPKKLAEHGQKFLEESSDGSREDYLAEGTYYFTFLLCAQGYFKNNVCEPVRFSETIPSASTVIARVENELRILQLQDEVEMREEKSELARNELKMKLQRSRKALADVTTPQIEADPLEAAVRKQVEPIIRAALVKAHTRVQMAIELASLPKKLQAMPGWKNLSKKQRDQILKDVASDLDGDEGAWNP